MRETRRKWRPSKSAHCFGVLIFATFSSLRPRIFEKSWTIRQCTLARDFHFSPTMSPKEQKTQAPPRSCTPYPRTNSVSRQAVLYDSGTSLARFSMVSLSCFVFVWIKNVIFYDKSMSRPQNRCAKFRKMRINGMVLAANKNHPVHVGFGGEQKASVEQGFCDGGPSNGIQAQFWSSSHEAAVPLPFLPQWHVPPPALFLEVESVKLVLYFST